MSDNDSFINNLNLQEELKKCKTIADLTGKNGLLKRILKHSIENMLEAEIEEHLGYAKHSPAGKNTGNSRNGKNSKKVTSDYGELEIETPRDRNGEFTPKLVKKRQTAI